METKEPKFYVYTIMKKIDTKESNRIAYLQDELERAKEDIGKICDKYQTKGDIANNFCFLFLGDYLCVTKRITFARKHKKQIVLACFDKELTVE